ncbi:efflux RND transporter periplasmic adaptor subunit [Filomicrobium sp.]|uniref:efflux RND transporter periplasmic adaptor subunit n=1 Tax=Filomicrobium sp. TaxID=2024831 RepID=UPI0025868816|nr:efflux RND transporter periplasmic adaptor subunit [Filomicrobium sp.]MCV0371777.1 efflux RND transporter periplasmic adaptor subunit [Filomicrobium sp.]
MTWKGVLFLLATLGAIGAAVTYADPALVKRLVGEQPSLTNSSENLLSAIEGTSTDEFERGPNNGRLLRSGNFAFEITIFETGVPPEFHCYVYENEKLIDPNNVEARVELARLGGDVDELTFTAQGDYLKSSSPVIEPHSFDVKVSATYQGKSHTWTYSSYEGRTSITEEAAAASGISLEKAGQAIIAETVELTGSVVLNQDRTTRIKARFPGVVRKVTKNVGERVKEGEILAVVESNTSLNNYEVRAPFDGVILERLTNVGDVTGDSPIFMLSDLSSVWAEFHVFSQDLDRIKPGQKIRVRNVQSGNETESTVKIFTPVAQLSSQSVLARVTLENGHMQWRPGMTIRGKVVIEEHDVSLAVKTSALQRFRDFTVVFAKVDTTYEVRMLDLGISDGIWTEVKGGLQPGTEYVTENSFLVKADVEKSGASHDH